MAYIEQCINAGTTTTNDYFLISRGNIYYKLKQSDLFNDLQAAFGSGIVLGSIDEHTDVDTTTVAPTLGQALVWNNTNWVPGSAGASTLDALTDVVTAGLVTGSLLRYNGTNWVPTAVADYFQNGGETAAAARTIGNNSAHSFGIETNNTERLRVLSTGEIGINSTTNTDIDDAQLFVRSSKLVTSIFYNTNTAVETVFQGNNASTTRKEIGRLSSYFNDATNGAEYGSLSLNVTRDGTASTESGVLTVTQYYDTVSAANVDSLGVQIVNDGSSTSTNAMLHIYELNAMGGVAASDYNLLKIDSLTLATQSVLEVKANGWIIAKNLPTSSAGLPTGALWRDSGTIKIA